MKFFHVAIIAPYSYQPFRSIRQIAELYGKELNNLGHETTILSPPSVLGDMTLGAGGPIHKALSAFERMFFSPAGLAAKLRKLQKAAQKKNLGFLVLLTDQSLSPLNLTLGEFRVIQIVNDLTALRAVLGEFGESKHSFGTRFNQNLILSGLARANNFICVSGATAEDLRRLIAIEKSAPITVTPLPTVHPYRPLAQEELAQGQAALWRRLGILPPNYILHVGTSAWYKNRGGLIKIAGELRKRNGAHPSLVFAGEPPSAHEQSLIDSLDIRFHYFRGLNNEELNILYSGAKCVVLPSFAEGFCWPALEALQSGAPLAITDIPVLFENFSEGAAVIFPTPSPDNPPEWISIGASRLEEVFSLSAEDRQDIIDHGLGIAAGFTAERFRAKLSEAIKPFQNQ